jgi:hypothetical protein
MYKDKEQNNIPKTKEDGKSSNIEREVKELEELVLPFNIEKEL